MTVTRTSENDLSYYDNTRHVVLPTLPIAAHRILDIGGGTGATALAAKERTGATLAGIVDISDTAREARRDGLDFAVKGNVEDVNLLVRLTRDYGPFDLVLCLDVLEHLVDPWGLVARVHSVLTPGGCMVASIPNVRHYSASLRLLMGKWKYRDAGVLDRTHLRFFGREGAKELVTSSGMVLESMTSTRSYNHRTLSNILDVGTFGLFRDFLAWQYVFRVRKSDG